MKRYGSTFVLTAAITCLGVCAAQETPKVPSQRAKDLVRWAPEWKVGDWWLVKVYQPDLDLETGGSYSEPRAGQGVPVGFAPTNRLLYQVTRRELVRYPSDPPKAKPEAFLVVTVRALDGLRNRSAELWYTEQDMSLAKVVTSERDRAGFLSGTAQLRVASSGTLGVPLEWPDFRAAAKPRATLTGHRGLRIRQQVKSVGERVRVQLQAAPASPRSQRGPQKAKQLPRVLFDWQEGRPSWSRVRTRDRYAELVRFGDEHQLPKRYRRN